MRCHCSCDLHHQYTQDHHANRWACGGCTGSLESDDSTAPGDLPPTVKSIKWAYSTRPVYGWGDSNADQKSTAGWLAALPVFEPHWQVACTL